MKLRSVLRPLLGRERALWRALPYPYLRLRCFHDPIDCIVFALLVALPEVFFIQIGSNDGKSSGDPLWTFRRYRNWRGLLVEPVDYVFQRLVQNYTPWQARFQFENAAVTRPGDTRPFHYVAQHQDTAGYHTLGSFDAALLRKYPDAEKLLVSTQVQCLSWAELCARHNVRQLDLLHIDAEGSDAEIIEQIDFTRLQPHIVLYEHAHLSPTDRQHTAQRLTAAGYASLNFPVDTLAVRRSALTDYLILARAWHLIRAST